MAERRDVIRTKTALSQAYIDLLYLKKKDKITVRDILERANFSHGTFYAHFRDIEELEKHVEEIVIEDCRRAISQSTEVEVEPLLTAMEPRRKELRELHRSGNLSWVSDAVKKNLTTAMVRSATRETPDVTTICICVTSALVDATLNWLVTDDGPDRATFLKTVTTFLTGGIEPFLNKS